MYILTYTSPDGKTPARFEYAQEQRDEAIAAFFTAYEAGMVNLWLQHVDGPVMISPGNRTK